uniref:Aminopeptidase N-like N-terminal domain-containing protein n=1 Tax=Caenorhabditis japonica TaxID=281687 RepID=A0A8R1IQB8_CAEJA
MSTTIEDEENPPFQNSKFFGLFKNPDPGFTQTGISMFTNFVLTNMFVYGVTGRAKLAYLLSMVSIPCSVVLSVRDSQKDYEKWKEMRLLRLKGVPERKFPTTDHLELPCQMAPPHPRDPSTAANYEQVTVSHYALKWKVDFEKKNINGDVEIVLNVKQDTDKIILDSRDLNIQGVTLSKDGEEKKTGFVLEDNQALGQKLVVSTDLLKSGDKAVLNIKYETSNNAAAIQFLTAEQTTDRVAPYLFSQCQAINARSIVPCMDTPSLD